MAERLLIVSNLEYKYKGTYSMKKLDLTIQDTMRLRGYSEDNIEHYITAAEEGKKQIIKYTYSKKTTPYDTSIIIIRAIHENVIPVQVKISGKISDRQQGTLRVVFRGEVKSNREGFIGYTPWIYFWRVIGAKFVSSKIAPQMGTDIDGTIKAVYDELWLFTRGEKNDE